VDVTRGRQTWIWRAGLAFRQMGDTLKAYCGTDPGVGSRLQAGRALSPRRDGAESGSCWAAWSPHLDEGLACRALIRAQAGTRLRGIVVVADRG
jgi:hypothetical protein